MSSLPLHVLARAVTSPGVTSCPGVSYQSPDKPEKTNRIELVDDSRGLGKEWTIYDVGGLRTQVRHVPFDRFHRNIH